MLNSYISTDFFLQFLVCTFLLFFLFITNKSSIKLQYKILVSILVLFESITTFIFFSNKFTLFFSFLVLFSSLFSLFYLFNLQKVSFLKRTTLLELSENYIPYFKFIGVLWIIVTFSLEIFFLDGNFSQATFFSLIVGIIWLLFDSFSPKLTKEKFFILFFFNFLFFLLIVPSIITNNFSGITIGAYWVSTPKLVELLLAKPVVLLLNFIGYNFHYSGEIVYYSDLTTNLTSSVFISQSCSGIHSVFIFVSAFLSYVIVNGKSSNIETTVFLLYGLLFAYLANLFRMAIIILSGHYYGSDMLSWTHKNLGSVIFLVWMFIFFQIYSMYMTYYFKNPDNNII